MNIVDIITPERTLVLDNVADKTQALEKLSAMLGGATQAVTADDILSSLASREKLGSTGIGEGVAIPHGRLKGLDKCIGAMLRLGKGIDFKSADAQPVDLVFGLLVPQQSTQEHLEILRALAEMFTQADCVTGLRGASDATSLYTTLADYDPLPTTG